VKPQDFENLLKEIKDYAKTKLVMSIAAGITTDYIEKCLTKARIIRIMPNLPLKVNKGMICICKGKTANEKDLTFAKQLFKSMGEVLILEEKMMDAATAISGSGPGYLYDFCENKNVKDIRKYAREFFIPQLIASARNIGFSSQEAEMLATFTAEGSIFFLEKAKLSPAEAKKQVASKGGTTEAALEILHKGGSLAEAVKAACRRAQELSRR
jgi:pyrroline-5-carboxylate reductase